MAQTDIPRAAPADALPELIPARMLNEFAYCPRLAYLEWVQGEFAESRDTLDGTYQHRRVDKPGGAMPPPGPRERGRVKERGADAADEDGDDAGAGGKIHSRSVPMSAAGEGLLAVVDLIEGVEDKDEGGRLKDEGGGRAGARRRRWRRSATFIL